MNEKGEPNMVQKATILPPQSQMGAIDDSTRFMAMNQSQFKGKYDTVVDRETAYEKIKAELESEQTMRQEGKTDDVAAHTVRQKDKKAKTSTKTKKSAAEKAFERTANSALSTIGRKLGNELIKKFFK